MPRSNVCNLDPHKPFRPSASQDIKGPSVSPEIKLEREGEFLPTVTLFPLPSYAMLQDNHASNPVYATLGLASFFVCYLRR